MNRMDASATSLASTDAGSEIAVSVRNVSMSFAGTPAVIDASFDLRTGAFLTILGPSGSGKTTLLRMIAGFLLPTAGEIVIGGVPVGAMPPHKRSIGMVFQRLALFPHMSAAENVAFPLRMRRFDARTIPERVERYLDLVRLGGFGTRRVHELSGGQQQRVAIARALVFEPKLLLLDEPLAALDKKLRTAMQIELQSLQRDLGITFVLVTHDQEEALSMSDLVCVMNAGRIVQMASPREIYDRPADLFVADFVGKTNILDASVVASGRARLADGSMVAVAPSDRVGAATVAIRPEAIRLARGAAGDLTGTVTNRIFLGATAEYAVRVPGVGDLLVTADHQSTAQAPSKSDLVEPGETVALTFAPGAALVFPARTSA
jgi:spermidine/putrescine transport system ATP-binding protein